MPEVNDFRSLDDVETRLAEHGHLADRRIQTAALLTAQLSRPLLVEGPAGTGKTSLAQKMAAAQGRTLIRLQCYEGIDESRALYEWEYAKQLLYTQILRDRIGTLLEGALTLDDALSRLRGQASAFFSEDFLLARPLLQALRANEPTLLLLDEIDKADPEFEAFLLEMLAEMQVTIPELGTVKARVVPQVVLTSNRARELSDPLRRRCLHLTLTFPDAERERAIIRAHLPDIDEALMHAVVRAIQKIRTLELRKAPSIGEAVDWARALVLLGRGVLDDRTLDETLGVIVKHEEDARLVRGAVRAIVDASRGA
jgi:MoxR-like ATPase